MFRYLGLHPGPDISAAAAASLGARTPAETRADLRSLTAANLLGEPATGRYQLHDLLRVYAAEVTAATDPQAAAASPRSCHPSAP